MAFKYYLYRTDYNNTLVDRGDNSFAPLPPNTGEIFSNFLIPDIQPLYYYRESGGTIIENSDSNIRTYENEVVLTATTLITLPSKKFFAGKTTTQVLTTSFSPIIDWVSPNIINTDTYSFDTTTGEITFKKDGFYDISFYYSVDVDSGSARSIASTKLQENITGTYADIPFTRSFTYNRQDTEGTTSASVNIIRSYGINNKLRIVGRQESGTDTLSIIGNSVGLKIIKSEIGSDVDGLDIDFDAFSASTNNRLTQLELGSSGGTNVFYGSSRTSSGGIQLDGFNLTVNKGGTGIYNYFFETNPLSANYSVFAQPMGSGISSDANAQVINVTSNGFTVQIGIGDNGGTPDTLTDIEHSVGVFGVPIVTNITTAVSANQFTGYTATTESRLIALESGSTSNDGVVSGATLNGNILELKRTEGLPDVTVDFTSLSLSGSSGTTGIPYSGATFNVDLNNRQLNNVNSIQSSNALFGDNPDNLRSFNVKGSGFNGRLSIQGFSGDNPGIEMTTDANSTRVLLRLQERLTNGTSLQIFTEKDGGGTSKSLEIDEDAALYLFPENSPSNAVSNAGFRNLSGNIQYKNATGNWTNIDTNDGVVSGATLNGNILELKRTEGLPDVTVDVSSITGNSLTLNDFNSYTGLTDNRLNSLESFTATTISNESFTGYTATTNQSLNNIENDIDFISGETSGNTNLININTSNIVIISGDVAQNSSDIVFLSGITDNNYSDFTGYTATTNSQLVNVFSPLDGINSDDLRFEEYANEQLQRGQPIYFHDPNNFGFVFTGLTTGQNYNNLPWIGINGGSSAPRLKLSGNSSKFSTCGIRGVELFIENGSNIEILGFSEHAFIDLSEIRYAAGTTLSTLRIRAANLVVGRIEGQSSNCELSIENRSNVKIQNINEVDDVYIEGGCIVEINWFRVNTIINLGTLDKITKDTDPSILTITKAQNITSGSLDIYGDYSVVKASTIPINIISGATSNTIIGADNTIVDNGINTIILEDIKSDISFISGETDNLKNSALTGLTVTSGGTNVSTTGGSFNTINFNNDFVVTESGRTANVSLPSATANKIQLIDTSGGQTLNDVLPNPIEWNGIDIIDNNVFSFVTGTSSITVLKDGYYELSYNINGNSSGGGRAVVGVQYRVNSLLIDATLTTNYRRDNSNSNTNNSLAPYIKQLNANDVIDVVTFRLGSSQSQVTTANQSFVRINYLGE